MRKILLPILTLKGIKDGIEIKGSEKDNYLIQNPMIVGHPLNYNFSSDSYDLAKVEEDISEGNIVLVGEKELYNKILKELSKYEPRALSILMVYNSIARNEHLNDSDYAISVALKDLKELLDIEEKQVVDNRKVVEIRKIVSEVEKLKGNEKIVGFDKLVQKLHFDPDFLRHLPIYEELYLATLIRNYLDILRYGSIEKLLKEMEDYLVVKNLDKYLKMFE